MLKILLSGCNGKMGRAVVEAAENGGLDIVAGIDINQMITQKFPVYAAPADYGASAGKSVPVADVIIDFSHHSAIGALLKYAVNARMPLVVATTAHTAEEKALIEEASKKTPVFISANMSLGINLLLELSKKAAALLEGGFDIEIVERHHRRKLDAPSGTALMIADGISSALADKPEYVYDRTKRRESRPKNEIGIHAVRGGTIVGEHEVIFAGHDEVLTISHSAISREIFTAGAIKAACFICGKENGLYTMKELIGQTMGQE